MKIYLGADHAGYEMKNQLKEWLESNEYDTLDLGAFTNDPVDYPDIAREVAEKVNEAEGSRGVLVCGSGEGMCMTANKHVGVRAALADSPERAAGSREHNNANIVCIGSRFTDLEVAKQIVESFLTTEFSDAERHQRRVEKMNAMHKA